MTDLNENSITVKEIIDENFQDYKKAAMFISAAKCDFKCLKEQNLDCGLCQNSRTTDKPDVKISFEKIFKRYKNNLITSAVVIGGLEPFLQFEEVFGLIKYFRNQACSDDFVIYTGYRPEEVGEKIKKLKDFENIIIKFGRFIPDSTEKFDEILGVTLCSENQYGEKIS